MDLIILHKDLRSIQKCKSNKKFSVNWKKYKEKKFLIKYFNKKEQEGWDDMFSLNQENLYTDSEILKKFPECFIKNPNGIKELHIYNRIYIECKKDEVIIYFNNKENSTKYYNNLKIILDNNKNIILDPIEFENLGIVHVEINS